jgi:hypothetical protein
VHFSKSVGEECRLEKKKEIGDRDGKKDPTGARIDRKRRRLGKEQNKNKNK